MNDSKLLKEIRAEITIKAFYELVSAVELEGKIKFNEQVLYIYTNTLMCKKDLVFALDAKWEIISVDECISPAKYRLEAIKVEEGNGNTV